MKRKLNEHDVPEPINSGDGKTSTKTTKSTFATLNLDPRLLQAVKKYKFSSPTPVQTKAIPLILEGKDVLARAKTGSGKTLAYLLPILHSILHRKAANKRSKSTSTLVLVPTKELANQVNTTVQDFTAFCVGEIKCENINRTQDAAVTKARLADKPDIVVGTPAQAVQWNNQEALELDGLKHLVIDEADLTISYQHEDALEVLATSLPTGVQKIMTSATLSTEVDTVSRLFFEKGEGAGPVILDLSEEEAAEKPTLAQYIFPTAEDEKFLLIYTIFKLQLIRGKVIVFVADIDRCYRVKLFLEQFGIRSCVLNSELPVNSRLHVVEEFNRGVYDIIVAADDGEVVGVEEAKSANRKRRRLEKQAAQEEEQENGENEEEWEGMAEGGEGDQPERKDSHTNQASAVQSPGKKERKPRNDREYGVSRGIDFRYVTCVLNFDMPTTSKSYTHRIGRTARAGQTGMALSFYVPHDQFRKHKPTSIPQCENDEKVLEKIMKKQAETGNEVKEWGLDRTKLEGFRYRLADALRAVTRIAVREARTKELRSELIKSEKLKRHFEENPDDLRHLRHDTESHAVRQQPHLKHVPDYLLPSGGKAAVSKDVGFVGMRKDKENRIRKARAFNKSRGKGRLAKGKGLDPLKSLNVKGRGKK